MSPRSTEQHHSRERGWPEWSRQNITLTAALRMVRMYGDRMPSVAQLRADFGVSRATAFGWRAAFREATEQNEAAHAG